VEGGESREREREQRERERERERPIKWGLQTMWRSSPYSCIEALRERINKWPESAGLFKRRGGREDRQREERKARKKRVRPREMEPRDSRGERELRRGGGGGNSQDGEEKRPSSR
jgi:hypothetical protein